MRKQYKTLLFDVDGTLMDFDASEAEQLRYIFQPFGEDRVESMIDTYRRINHELWDSYEKGLITKLHITDARFDAVFKEYGIIADGKEAELRYRRRLNQSAILIPGAVNVLEELKDHFQMYVVTNGFADTQKPRMADSGLDRYFIESFISEEIGYQKPQKEFFDYCFSHMNGVERGSTLIIGDSLKSDIKGGIQAGIDTCWYNPHGKEADGMAVTMEIHDLKELPQLLLC